MAILISTDACHIHFRHYDFIDNFAKSTWYLVPISLKCTLVRWYKRYTKKTGMIALRFLSVRTKSPPFSLPRSFTPIAKLTRLHTVMLLWNTVAEHSLPRQCKSARDATQRNATRRAASVELTSISWGKKKQKRKKKLLFREQKGGRTDLASVLHLRGENMSVRERRSGAYLASFTSAWWTR